MSTLNYEEKMEVVGPAVSNIKNEINFINNETLKKNSNKSYILEKAESIVAEATKIIDVCKEEVSEEN